MSYQNQFHTINLIIKTVFPWWNNIRLTLCFNRGKHYFIDGVHTKQAQSLATVRPTPPPPVHSQLPFCLFSLALSLFSTLSFCLLPSCFLSGLSLNTNNFFWQSIYGEVDWCVWGVGAFPKIHTIKRKHKHTLTSHIQADIHRGAVVCNKVKLCPECGHWGKLLSCHFLIGAKKKI